MNTSKKILSVVLSLLMVLSTMAVGGAGLAFAADTDNVYFFVPECVYLAPGSTAGQYYLNSYADKDTTTLGTTDNAGKFYFHADGATAISVSVEGATVEGLTTSVSGDTLSDDSFTITASSSDFRGLMTYNVTYTVDGEQKTAVSYTYIYAPNRVPSGAFGWARNEYSDEDVCVGVASVVWGYHTYTENYTTGSNGTKTTKGPADSLYLGGSGINIGDLEGIVENGSRVILKQLLIVVMQGMAAELLPLHLAE